MDVDEPPSGFRGLDPELPIRVYVRHVPHWRQVGATYFVTFRLADALPQDKLDELKGVKQAWELSHPNPTDRDWRIYVRTVLQKTERWLDEGYGACVLAQPAYERVAVDALHHFDGTRYTMFAHVVMPNHLHLVVRPSPGHELEDLIKSWKQHVAVSINRREGRSGPLWQEDYFDRIVRDTSHLRRVIHYIRENPKKAGARGTAWVTPEWREWLTT